MSVKLTLEFESYEALVAFVVPNAAAVNKANFSVTHPIVAPAAPSEATQPTQEAAPTEPKRRGRPPKVAPAPSEAAQPAQEAAPSEPSVVEAPKHEQALAAQKALYDAKGAEACIVVLQRHGANRISEIKPEQRARFIQDCNDALAGKDLSAAA